jgi:AraC-like DNA-binding protein
VRAIHRRRGTPAELRSLLGCEVEFGANVDEVVFPGTVKLMLVVSADPYLNGILTKYCDEGVAYRRASRDTLRPDLENAIAPLLPHGKARAGEIARRLGMSRRTLARRLASEGLNLLRNSGQLKTDPAKRYLRDDELAISQIAWLLGYREVSAFTHAFKRWIGKTPRQARAQGNLTAVDDRTRMAGIRSQARSRR